MRYRIPGGRQEAGQAGMLRGSQARRRLSPEVAYPPSSKGCYAPGLGQSGPENRNSARGHQTVGHGLVGDSGVTVFSGCQPPLRRKLHSSGVAGRHLSVEAVERGSPSGRSWLKVGRTADTRYQLAGSGGPPVADVVIGHRGRQVSVNGRRGPCRIRNLLTLGCHRFRTLSPIRRRHAAGTRFGSGDAHVGTAPKSTGLK